VGGGGRRDGAEESLAESALEAGRSIWRVKKHRNQKEKFRKKRARTGAWACWIVSVKIERLIQGEGGKGRGGLVREGEKKPRKPWDAIQKNKSTLKAGFPPRVTRAKEMFDRGLGEGTSG